MEQTYPVIEFEAEVTEHGTIQVPGPLSRGLAPGARVTVRLTRGVVGALRKRGVSEEEIERIAALQLEPRENVLRFLGAEGALAAHRPKGRR